MHRKLRNNQLSILWTLMPQLQLFHFRLHPKFFAHKYLLLFNKAESNVGMHQESHSIRNGPSPVLDFTANLAAGSEGKNDDVKNRASETNGQQTINTRRKEDVDKTTIVSVKASSRDNAYRDKENVYKVAQDGKLLSSNKNERRSDTATVRQYRPNTKTTKVRKDFASNKLKQIPHSSELPQGIDRADEKQDNQRNRKSEVQGDSNGSRTNMRQISMEEAVSKFKYKASKECINKCPDSTSDTNPLSYSSLCQITRQGEWANKLGQVGAELTPFLDKDVYVYPYEREYLSYPKAREIRDLPSAKKSRVVLIGAVTKGKFSTVTCKLGETVAARLDVVDGAGRPRTSGGDEVRAWVGATYAFDGSRIDSMYPRAMAAVVDLHNGSYRIEIACLWAGRSRLVVRVRYPREFLRMVIETVRSGLSRFLGARFQKGAAVEEVPCLATPNIPGRPCICNLTSLNGGAPFYCARPLNTSLSCRDWKVSGTMTKVTPGDMAAVEGKFVMKRQDSLVSTDHISISTEATISGGGDNSQPQLFIAKPVEPCTKASRRITWSPQRPTGYWRDADRNWEPLLCREPIVTENWMRACLKDSSVWIIGDSNGIRQYYKVAVSAGLKHLFYGPMPFFDVVSRSSRKENINVHYSPHEHPLYVTKDWKQLDVDFVSVPAKIDAIPSKGRHILIFHYFLHLTPVHLGLARSRFQAAHGAILRLLARNPQATVAIRGPHTVSLNAKFDIAIGGDSLAHFLVDIIKDVFKDVQDRVLFLDGWELSLSLESAGIHPAGAVPIEISRRLFSFVCDESVGNDTRKL